MANSYKTKKNKKSGGASMSRAFMRMTRTTVIVFLIEILVIGAVAILWFLDFPEGWKDLVKIDYWVFALIAVAFLDMMLVIISETRIGKVRRKGDLDTATIVGSDVQEAYNFGQLGLVVTDDDGMVLWINSLFKNRRFNLLDRNILEWEPSLKELSNAPTDHSVKLEIDSRHYSVRYLHDARLYIFKDITDYEQVSQYNAEQAVCIGIVMIDNYSDVAGKTEDDNNDLISKIRQEIFEYSKKHGLLLRRFRSDSYFAVCNFKTLDSMEKDGFSILQTVRALGKGQNVTPTLSIGFAHHFDDVNKLSEMANNAIDISMSRGGDQAVISHYGEELRFFGGRTAALENTGRVQFRSVADSIISIIRGSSNVIVSGHNWMDMDSLGACLGIYIMCSFCNVPCQIVFDPKNTETKTREAFRSAFSKIDLEKMTITSSQAEEKIRASTLFVAVDVSVPNNVMGSKALEKSSKTIVIDHHRRSEQFIDKPVLQHIDTSASSATEIVTEFIRYATANPRIEIPSTFATVMLAGMFLDTAFFKSKSTGIRSFEAAETLKEFGADNALATSYLQDTFEEYELITSIAATVKTAATGVVYCVSDEKNIVEAATLAKVGNQFIALNDIRAAFVIGRVDAKKVKVSARSDGSINVQLLCEKIGRGGGHINSAAAEVDNASIEYVLSKLLNCLDTYLAEAQVEQGEEE